MLARKSLCNIKLEIFGGVYCIQIENYFWTIQEFRKPLNTDQFLIEKLFSRKSPFELMKNMGQTDRSNLFLISQLYMVKTVKQIIHFAEYAKNYQTFCCSNPNSIEKF